MKYKCTCKPSKLNVAIGSVRREKEFSDREKPIDLLATTDAMVWAVEFCKTKKKMNWSLDDIDEGLMVGWFANAMVAQEITDREERIKLFEESEEVLLTDEEKEIYFPITPASS